MEIVSFKKNHPKNALGYVLAVRADGETDEIFEQYVIKSSSDARLDATGLGFLRESPETNRLTKTGREAVRTLSYQYGSIAAALEKVDAQSGRSARFIDVLPVMGIIIRQVLLDYRPTELLLNALDTLAERGHLEPSLSQVAKTIAQQRPSFALDFFVAPDSRDDVRNGSTGELNLEKFDDGLVYSTHTTFQYKAMLYHAGVLTTRGNDKKSDLDPNSVIWALEDPI
ncbi:hypothetical protein [Halobellus rarus]|uniref:Transposase n=1 Tax=Halobellus rarus TaxID=1126237 RepID=A0ABD6CTQ4_9EURY|nr:hypothetical protein [Halobellus rarus]